MGLQPYSKRTVRQGGTCLAKPDLLYERRIELAAAKIIMPEIAPQELVRLMRRAKALGRAPLPIESPRTEADFAQLEAAINVQKAAEKLVRTYENCVREVSCGEWS